jgi:hypothetical protein
MFLLYLCMAFAATGVLAYALWPKIGARFFRDSETLFFARLQVAAGALLTVLVQTNLAPIFSAYGVSDYLPIWLIASGAVTEVLRKSRATDLK